MKLALSNQPFLTLVLLQVLLLPRVAVRAHPTKCPNTDTIVGYSDFSTLQNDINSLSAESAPEDAVFVICPGTTFRLSNDDQGLRFHLAQVGIPSITVACGPNGSSQNNCVIQGGLHHVWVEHKKNTPIAFQGITFESATRGSVWTGDGANDVAFKDCVWQNNVYNWNANPGTDRCPTGCYGAVGGRDGSTFFEKCTFISNQGDSGAVYGENMAYTFNGCSFKRNRAVGRDLGSGTPATGSAISLHNSGSTLSLSDTCFEDNVSNGPATVLVEDSSNILTSQSGTVKQTTSLRENTNNYLEGNLVLQPNQNNFLQYCHNSIYNYIRNAADGAIIGSTNIGHEWTLDVCVQGTAKCCQECDDNDNDTPTPAPTLAPADNQMMLLTIVIAVAAVLFGLCLLGGCCAFFYWRRVNRRTDLEPVGNDSDNKHDATHRSSDEDTV